MKISRTFYLSTAAVSGCILLIILRVVFGSTPSTHPEANNFIMHYNSGESFIRMIFDPAKTDWSNYQARELSYVLDYLDARFIMQCIVWHHTHFYSLSALVLLVISALVILYNLRKLYPEAAEKGYALGAVLAYTAVNLCNIGFFRSSKPAVTFLVTVIFFQIIKLLKFPEKYRSWRSAAVSAAVLLLLPWFDRIGFFAVAVCGGGSTVLLLFNSTLWRDQPLAEEQKKPLFIFAVSAQISLLLSLLYNFYAAPYLVEYLHGYRPSFHYQHIPLDNWPEAGDIVLYILGNAGTLITPFSGVLAVFAGVFLISAAVLAAARAKNNHEMHLWRLGFAGISAAVLVCNVMMLLRHPMILELPWRGGYFQVFSAVLLLFFTVLQLECKKFSWLTLFFVCVIISNCWTSVFVTPGKHLRFHRESTAETIRLLNDPQQKIDVILPSSSRELIIFSREKCSESGE